MAKGKLPLLGLAATSLLLSACVVKVWETTFPGSEDSHTQFNEMVTDHNGNAYALGREQVPGIISHQVITKHNSQGELLWKQKVADSFNLNFYYDNDFIQLDSQSNIFVAGLGVDFNQLSLLSTQGEVLWQHSFPADTNYLPNIYDIEITQNDVLLAIGLLPDYRMIAFDQTGNELWRYNGGPRLDQYGNPRAPWVKSEIVINDNNVILVSNGSHLSKLNEQGDVITTLNASDLNIDYFVDIEAGPSNFAVMAVKANTLKLYILSEGLNVLGTHDLQQIGYEVGYVAMGDDDYLCYATKANTAPNGNETNPHAIDIGMFSLQNDQGWHDQIDQPVFYRELTALHATAGEGCRIATTRTAADRSVASYVHIYSRNGELSDTLKISKFVAWGSHHDGNSIYSAGFEENETSLKPVAKMYKHEIR